MKRFISMIIAVVITIGSFISIAAAEQTDFSAYEIRDRFTPVDIYMLNGNSLVAETWSDRYGDITRDWHITWFQDGEILREVDYNPIGNLFYMPVPHTDGTCGMIEMTVAKDREENRTGITLYDWNENGLVNPRVISEDADDVRVAFGGFTVRNKNTKELSLYNNAGELLYLLKEEENRPVWLECDRLGNFWVMTVHYMKDFEENIYTLRCIKDGAVNWEKKVNEGTAFYPDQQGGLYCIVRLGSGSYRTVGITHLDSTGEEDFRKTLSADKVVLGCAVSTNPKTGEIYLTGRAVANSRKVYCVYRMTLDQNWNMTDLDVRKMDYYHDINPRVFMNLDNDFYVHSNGLDENDQGGINPVIIPFDELEKTDNLGIRIQ